MSVSWITGIYNNTEADFFMWANDTAHLGIVRDLSGTEVGRNEDGGVVRLAAGGHYTADWCGIPWYADERHYRAISTDGGRDPRKALLIWQSTVDSTDGIVLINGARMTRLGGIEFGSDADHRYALLIDPATDPAPGPYEIRLELRNTNDTAQRIVNLLGRILGDAYDDSRTLRIEAGKAAIGAAAGKA